MSCASQADSVKVVSASCSCNIVHHCIVNCEFLQAGVVGLLKGSQVARFALPAPEGSRQTAADESRTAAAVQVPAATASKAQDNPRAPQPMPAVENKDALDTHPKLSSVTKPTQANASQSASAAASRAIGISHPASSSVSSGQQGSSTASKGVKATGAMQSGSSDNGFGAAHSQHPPAGSVSHTDAQTDPVTSTSSPGHAQEVSSDEGLSRMLQAEAVEGADQAGLAKVHEGPEQESMPQAEHAPAPAQRQQSAPLPAAAADQVEAGDKGAAAPHTDRELRAAVELESGQSEDHARQAATAESDAAALSDAEDHCHFSGSLTEAAGSNSDTAQPDRGQSPNEAADHYRVTQSPAPDSGSDSFATAEKEAAKADDDESGSAPAQQPAQSDSAGVAEAAGEAAAGFHSEQHVQEATGAQQEVQAVTQQAVHELLQTSAQRQSSTASLHPSSQDGAEVQQPPARQLDPAGEASSSLHAPATPSSQSESSSQPSIVAPLQSPPDAQQQDWGQAPAAAEEAPSAASKASQQQVDDRAATLAPTRPEAPGPTPASTSSAAAPSVAGDSARKVSSPVASPLHASSRSAAGSGDAISNTGKTNEPQRQETESHVLSPRGSLKSRQNVEMKREQTSFNPLS